MTYLIT